jgi:quinol monooxygenase YgiN
MSYEVIAKFTARSGRRDELVQHLIRAADLLGADPDCLHYLVSTSEEADAVWVTEVWTDRDAHAASLEREDVRALVGHARPLIAGMSDRHELEVQGGKGLRP